MRSFACPSAAFYIYFCTLLLCNYLCSALESTPNTSTTTKPINDTILSNKQTHKQIIKRQSGGTCIPISVINGQVNYLQTNPNLLYSSGTTAILTCNLGFTIMGSSNSICISSMWSPTIGACTSANGLGTDMGMGMGMGIGMGSSLNNLSAGQGRLSCLPQLPPLNGQVFYSQGSILGSYSAGTAVTLRCNAGSLSTGSTVSTCMNGMWNPVTLGQCSMGLPNGGLDMNSLGNMMTRCVMITPPINGRIDYSLLVLNGGYPSGTMATLVCNPGTIASQMTSICGTNGLWSPLIGTCNPVGSTFHDVANRNIREDFLTNPLSTAMPFMPMLFGSNTISQCLFGILPPMGGLINYSSGSMIGPYSSGTMASLSCRSGKVIGPSVSTCQNGQWNPPMFQSCTVSDDVANGNAMGALLFTSPATPLSLNGLGSTMGIDGNPNNDDSQKCLFAMANVQDGMIIYSQGLRTGPFPMGTIATLQCNNGGTSMGSMSSSCLNGIWSPLILGPCSSGSSGIGSPSGFTSPPFGGGFGGFPMGSTAMPLSGPNQGYGGISITPSGNSPFLMSTMFPTLVPMMPSQQCILGVLPPLNGRAVYSSNLGGISSDSTQMFGPYLEGTPARLVCNPGFIAQGETNAVCRGGMFQPPFGQCVSGGQSNLPGLNRGGMGISYTPSVNISYPDVKVDGCPNLTLDASVQGSIEYIESTNQTSNSMAAHSVGTLAKLLCNPGLVSTGSTSTTCMAQGWTIPVLGNCVASSVANDEVNNFESTNAVIRDEIIEEKEVRNDDNKQSDQ